MAWTAAKIPDQSGAVAVVTGANGGLGLGPRDISIQCDNASTAISDVPIPK
jgi:hypothetical protein